MIPFTFTYHSTFGWRQVADLSTMPHLLEQYKRDYDYIVINPPLTPVEFGKNIRYPFTSSDGVPSLDITLENVTTIGRNSLPSASILYTQTFSDKDAPALREYLRSRGWWCGVRLPGSPYEIADVERICYIAAPLWKKKFENMKSARSCNYEDYYIK